MNTPPTHFGMYNANQTLNWFPSDTEESFNRMMQVPEHREYFTKMGWDRPDAITYKFNSHGFRCAEFDDGPYLLTLGCSYTMGIGLPVETTWPELLAKQLGLKCANLAWGGYSADSCYRLAEYWISKLMPQYVCMLVPPRNRVELFLDASIMPENRQLAVEVFMPQSMSTIYNENDVYLNHWFLNEDNGRTNSRKNAHAVKDICNELGIKNSIRFCEDYMTRSREDIGYARDYLHGGPIIHEILAEEFYNEYQK